MKFTHILAQFLDTLLPRRARSMRIEEYKPEELRLMPTTHSLCGIEIITLMNYREPIVEDLVRALKYDRSTYAADLAAFALSEYLYEELAEKRIFSARRLLIVPIPLHNVRRRERGYNQIELVLEQLPVEFQNGKTSSMSRNALSRVRETPPQTRLSRAERLQNVSGAFRADDSIVKNLHVILIDDVTTTGATLAEASKSLTEAGAEVTALALARA